LTLGEFDRWAEPLQDNVSRVLAENLAFLMPTDQSLLQPRPRSAVLDYQVPFTFTGTLNKLTIAIDRPKLTPEDEKRLRAASQRD
jgi:hypothetical protein